MNINDGGLNLSVSDDNTMAYLYLPAHPQDNSVGAAAKQVHLSALIADYQGPEIILDFNKEGVAIGIELMLD